MNNIYQRIWSTVKEKKITISIGSSAAICGAITLAAVLLFPGAAFTLESGALPTEGKITSGSGSISSTGSQMTVDQFTQKMITNWHTFNIGRKARVTFRQPDANSTALNRIYDQSPSQILGTLSANGKIYLINPSGIVFGKSSQVNVGGLVASSLNMLDSDFLAGKNKFYNAGYAEDAGNVLNQGNISVIPGGIVALIAPKVINEGTITANSGSVFLGAGKEVTLDFFGDGLISYTVDKGAVDALAENSGLIKADGGLVVMTAKASDSLTSAVVNNSGVIEAQTLVGGKGHILLLSDKENGQAIVSGTLDASAPNGGDGGFIETSGTTVKVTDGTIITTAAPSGATGTWLIDPTNFTVASGSGALTTSGIGATTLLNALAFSNTTIATNAAGTENGDINVNANVTWLANNLSLQAYGDININAVLTARNTASLDMRAGYSTPGTDGGTYNGTNMVKVGFNNFGDFKGRVDFLQADGKPRSGTGFLTINGNGYTVITDLGLEGGITGTDLQGMNGNLAGYYALGGNINASATSGWNAGAGFAPIGDFTSSFTGQFDGLGHTITNLAINRPSQRYVGLFGVIYGNATISNVGLVGGSISGENMVGELVGSNYHGGMVTNSYATGNVTGNIYVGGLVGDNGFESSIVNSHATGRVSGSGDLVGGLTGGSIGTSITNCYATGNVSSSGNNVGGLVGENYSNVTNSYATGNVSGVNDVGGLFGYNHDDIITNVYATGQVNGSGERVGGLIGYNKAPIINSYATGRVSGNNYVGGLVGENVFGYYGGTITSSYASGRVSGNFYVGGLVGLNSGAFVGGNYYNGTVSDSFATGRVSGDNDVGGLVGHNQGGTVTNSYATGRITGNYNVGGLIGVSIPDSILGNSYDSMVTNSFATGRVNGNYDVGGLIGNNGGTIANSYATGRVNSSDYFGGGLVGANAFGSIENSFATGQVRGSYGVGGFVGLNSGGTITNTYATGRVSGSEEVGGLVGRNFNGSTVTNSYATGRVSGNIDVGGVVGFNDSSTVTSCYWNTTTSGTFIGIGGGSPLNGVLGLPTAGMKRQMNFTGWDFITVWSIIDGLTYPWLR